MTRKAIQSKGSIGFGDHVEKASQNFIGGQYWMQHIQKGTLKINPEYATKSLDDILTDGGLNFQVLKVPSEFKSPVSGKIYQSQSYSVIRADNDYELGYGFTSEYNPISYPDLLSQFFNGAVNLGGIPTRVVSFDGGAVGAIQLALPDEMLIADRPHKTFLNFYTSHDGRYGVTMNTCDICIICGNTFAHSFNDSTFKFTVKHTKNMNTRISEISARILNAEYANKPYYMLLNKASTVHMENSDIKNFLLAMFPDKEANDNGKVNQGPANQRILLENAISETAGERNTSDITAYDTFEGMLRYISYRQQNRNLDEQFQYAMTSQKNQDAYAWLTEKVK